MFNQFLTVHLEYADLLDSDSKFDSYRVVGNVSMNDYEHKVKSTYDKAYEDIVSYKNTLYVNRSRT